MKRRRYSRHKKQSQRGGAQSSLPITTWGSWAQYPGIPPLSQNENGTIIPPTGLSGALAWGNGTTAPPPLANGGLYTAPQSTGSWASAPFPATLYGWQVAAAQTAQNPDVFYHQRPNDNNGASFSPYVGTPISPLHSEPMYKSATGGRRPMRKTTKNRKQK